MKAAIRIIDAAPSSLAARFATRGSASRLLRPLVNRLVPDDPVVITVRSGPARGIRLPILPRSEKFYWTGLHEREVQDTLVALLRPGMTFWDIGAHIGFFSLLAANLVGHRGRVYAFEPMAENRSRLEKAIALNAAANVFVDERAVAEVPGPATLAAHEASTMWRLGGEGDRGAYVECATLDLLAAELPSPDVVKIDAEGAETAILRGGAELLRSARPVLIVENHGESLPPAVVDAYELQSVGPRHVLLT